MYTHGVLLAWSKHTHGVMPGKLHIPLTWLFAFWPGGCQQKVILLASGTTKNATTSSYKTTTVDGINAFSNYHMYQLEANFLLHFIELQLPLLRGTPLPSHTARYKIWFFIVVGSKNRKKEERWCTLSSSENKFQTLLYLCFKVGSSSFWSVVLFKYSFEHFLTALHRVQSGLPLEKFKSNLQMRTLFWQSYDCSFLRL